MRKLIFLMMVASLAFVLACADAAERPKVIANAPTNAADSHEAEHADDAPRITLADAKKEYDAGTAVFIDTRPPDSYKQNHVKGSLNITAAEINAKASTLPKGKKIIAYCSWPNEHTSASLVSELRKKGFDNAFALLGGTKAWMDAGYPMEKSE